MFKRLICAITVHKYFLIKNLSERTRKIGCSRCRRAWAMNDEVRVVVPWDSDFDQLYKDLDIFMKGGTPC